MPRDDDALDTGALPPGSTVETVRVAVLYVQRDFRELRRHLNENGRLDEVDRQTIARLDERVGNILERVDEMSAQKAPWWDRLLAGWWDRTGDKDAASRVRVLWQFFAMALIAFVVWFVVDAVRDERAFRREQLDAQRENARQQQETNDLLEEMAEPPLDFGPDSTDATIETD